MPSPPSEFLAGARALIPAVIGMIPFSLITGAAATSAGLTPLEGIAMSFLVFSGMAQLVVSQLFAAGSPAAVIVLTALVVSLRFLMYSAALAPHLVSLRMRWKLLLAYLMTDQAFAVGITRYQETDDAAHKHWYLLGAGLALWLPWQAGVICGAFLGARIPPEWSLDFAVTLTFLAMLVPAARDRDNLAAAITGGGVALAAMGLPYKLGLVVASLAGIVAGVVSARGGK